MGWIASIAGHEAVIGVLPGTQSISIYLPGLLYALVLTHNHFMGERFYDHINRCPCIQQQA